MTTDAEAHKHVMRKYFDAVNHRRLDDAEALIADDFVGHIGVLPGPVNGSAGFIAFLSGLTTAFPDLELAVSEMVADGEKVVSWVIASGTNRGEFLGMPATSAAAQWEVIHCTTLEGDKIVADRIMVDQLTLLRALGAVAN